MRNLAGRQISQVMQRLSRTQNTPPGGGLSAPNTIASGLGRAAEIANMNSSRSNQTGFSQMLASFQILRAMPNLNMQQFTELVGQSQRLPLGDDLPEPDLSEFDVDDNLIGSENEDDNE